MGKNKKRVILLTIILFILSFIYILIRGNVYTYKVMSSNLSSNLEVTVSNDVVEVIDKKVKDNYWVIDLKAKKEGKAEVFIHENSFNNGISLYVNKFKTITMDSKIGDCRGGKIIIVSLIIILVYMLYLILKKLIISFNSNLYNYKNIAYLSIAFFISLSIIRLVLDFINNQSYGILSLSNSILGVYTVGTFFILPVALVLSILITISNIVLVIKEGFNIRNILGFLLGLLICFFSIFPELFYRLNMKFSLVDIYNLNSAGPYIYNFLESLNYMILVYIELLLLSTIIVSIRAAKKIPEYNKDFIIILGCQIKKDGTLTNLLKARVDRAIEFSKMQKESTGKDIIFVPSGGKGSDEIIAEGEAMKNYLMSCNIKEENILVENKSKNTYENIIFSKKLMDEKKKNANVAFSTTNYHVFRSGEISSKIINNIEGIGSKTRSYFWLNAFIREFVATLFYEVKKHLLVIISISIINIIMILIKWFSNTI